MKFQLELKCLNMSMSGPEDGPKLVVNATVCCLCPLYLLTVKVYKMRKHFRVHFRIL